MTVAADISGIDAITTPFSDTHTDAPEYPWLVHEPGTGVGVLDPVAGYDEDDDDEDDDYYSGYDDYDDDDDDFDADEFDDEEEELDFDDDEDDEDL